MTFPVLIVQQEGQFSATLVGAPEVGVVRPSRRDAIASLKVEIQRRIDLGELVSLDVETTGVSALAGKYGDDTTLRELCDEAYAARDAEGAW